MSDRGLVVVISAPSGTGKGTVIDEVSKKHTHFKFSVSVTTRKPRKGEIEGEDYFFVDEKEFKKMIDNNELIEWVKYCDNYYGTPKKYLEKCCNNGYDVFLDIEVEGAKNIKSRYPESVLIFMLPPSFEELRRRITKRGSETEEVIEKRIKKAVAEIDYANNYDYVFFNESVEQAVDNVLYILKAEKLTFNRNKDILNKIK